MKRSLAYFETTAQEIVFEILNMQVTNNQLILETIVN